MTKISFLVNFVSLHSILYPWECISLRLNNKYKYKWLELNKYSVYKMCCYSVVYSIHKTSLQNNYDFIDTVSVKSMKKSKINK